MSVDVNDTLTYASFSCDTDDTDSEAERVLHWNYASHWNYAAEPPQGSVSGPYTNAHTPFAREAPAAQQPTAPQFDLNASTKPAHPAFDTGYTTLDTRSHLQQRDEVPTTAEMEYATRLWQQLIAKPVEHGCSVPGHAKDGAASRTTSQGEPGEREALGGASNHKYGLGEATLHAQRISTTGKSFAMQHHDRNASACQQKMRAGVKEKSQHHGGRSSEAMKGGVNAAFARIGNPDPHKQWKMEALAHADSILATLDASLANFIGKLKASDVPFNNRSISHQPAHLSFPTRTAMFNAQCRPGRFAGTQYEQLAR
jgi:hypothetical protein